MMNYMPKINEENTVVLVMDRSDEDAKLIKSLLGKAGFGVIQKATNAEALDYFQNAGAAIPLAIVDTATPGVQTFELLQQVQTANPATRVLLLAGKNETESISNLSVMPNVRARLSRPFRRAQFLGSVLELASQPLVRTA
jgi:response regulator RpfG family c-di-GMP phosphodiesterase